jgi:hypothetical protein
MKIGSIVARSYDFRNDYDLGILIKIEETYGMLKKAYWVMWRCGKFEYNLKSELRCIISLEINEQTIHNIKYVFVSVFYSNCDIIHWNEKNLKIIKSANNY